MQSQEYPDLPFVPPRAWGAGRDGKSVAYAVVHYTAGSERSTSAEDGAAYDQRRTDGTSTHFFHDADSTVQCVYTWDRANAALHKGNRLGVQHELCGTQQTRAQWLDPASDATITRAARQIARDCVKYHLPVRRLSVAETRAAWYDWPNGPRGIVGHVDITLAYPEDGGSHTDPGPEFPWDVLLARVERFITPGGDRMGILIKLLPNAVENRTWYADGGLRYALTPGEVTGKQELHRAGLLPLLNSGNVYTIQSTDPVTLDGWGVDLATLALPPLLTDAQVAAEADRIATQIAPAITPLVTTAVRQAIDGTTLHAPQ